MNYNERNGIAVRPSKDAEAEPLSSAEIQRIRWVIDPIRDPMRLFATRTKREKIADWAMSCFTCISLTCLLLGMVLALVWFASFVSKSI